MKPPFSYDEQNILASHNSPGTVHSQNTTLVYYY